MIKKNKIQTIGNGLRNFISFIACLIRMARTRMGIAFLTIMTCYIVINDVFLSSKQSQDGSLITSPSGLKSVSGMIPSDHTTDTDIDTDNNKLFRGSSLKKQRQQQHGGGDDDDDVCFHYDGILLISHADKDGFATVFFFYVMNQLLYAEKHNLLPWIHLDSQTNTHVYDDQEHNDASVPIKMTVTVLNGLQWDKFHDNVNDQIYEYPGQPILNYKDPNSQSTTITLDGTGIWNSYFDLPSKLDPIRHLINTKSKSASCHKKPIFQLSLKQIEPSLMMYCPYCVRAWRRKSTPPSLAQWDKPYQQWFEPMRKTAHFMVQKHFHPTEEMINRAHYANPIVEAEESCLAIHIRYSDKADRRKRIPLEDFRPYVEAYIQSSIWVGTTIAIYVATDSNQVLKDIYDTWPQKTTTFIRYQKGSSDEQPVLRSDNATAVFELSNQHHRTNTEVLTDILAMAQCEFMVHGMSAVTEAAHYLNLRLHNQSVNLEEEVTTGMNYVGSTKPTMTAKEFSTIVRTRLHEKRRQTDTKKKELDHN